MTCSCGTQDEKPDTPDFHQNIGEWCNSKIKLPKYKDLCDKSFEKVLQHEWTYVAKATIIKLMNSINSNKLWHFASCFECFYSWHWRGVNNKVTLGVNNKVNDV